MGIPLPPGPKPTPPDRSGSASGGDWLGSLGDFLEQAADAASSVGKKYLDFEIARTQSDAYAQMMRSQADGYAAIYAAQAGAGAPYSAGYTYATLPPGYGSASSWLPMAALAALGVGAVMLLMK